MKKLVAVFIAVVMLCLTACSEEKWHPDSTQVNFDTQRIKIYKKRENTDFGSGEMDWYVVTADAKCEEEPYYSLYLSVLIGVKYYPGEYYNSRNEEYSGYIIEEIRDVNIIGSAENMEWIQRAEDIFTSIDGGGDCAVIWPMGYFQAEHDKRVKNFSDYLPGIFLNYKTTIKEYFVTDSVSMFLKLYPEEIVSCTPEEYHLTIK